MKEVKLKLEFKRYETYEEKIREVYRPKGLLAYATAAREYVRLIDPRRCGYLTKIKKLLR